MGDDEGKWLERLRLLEEENQRLREENERVKLERKHHLRYFEEFMCDLVCGSELLDLKLFPDAKELTEVMGAFNAVRRHLFIPPDVKKLVPHNAPRKVKHRGSKRVPRYLQEVERLNNMADEIAADRFFSARDARVLCVSVGDGSTPRIACTMAFRTKWTCISVDPQMRESGPWSSIDRLFCVAKKIEDFSLTDFLHTHFPSNTTTTTTSSSSSSASSLEGEGVTTLSAVASQPFDSIVVIMMHCHTKLDETVKCLIGDNKSPHFGMLGVVTCPCCNWSRHQERLGGLEPRAVYDDVSMATEERNVRVWKVFGDDLSLVTSNIGLSSHSPSSTFLTSNASFASSFSSIPPANSENGPDSSTESSA